MTSQTQQSKTHLSELIAPSFYGVHRDVQAHRHTHYVLQGGRGSTKSTFVSIQVFLLMEKYPQCHALVLRKVGNTLRDSVYTQYLWALGALGLSAFYTCHVSPMEIIKKSTGQKILFRGADDRAKIKSIKAPFGYIGITHFEEKDQFDGRAEIRSILQSTMRGGKVFWNFETNNPPIRRSSWANKDALIVRDDRIVHHSDYRGVPAEWLESQFIAEAEHLKAENITLYQHEYLGIATGTGTEVFKNLALREIAPEQVREFDRIYNGVDWGYFPDPFAWNRMHYDAARRTLYIYDELTATETGNAEAATRLKDEHDVSFADCIFADSAEPKSIADFRKQGFDCRPVSKGKGSVDYSHKWLQSLARIVIDPCSCPQTAKEFSEYEYARTKDGEILSGYPDKNNHHIDAVRYGMWPVWRRGG